jgi:hypothetical protein
LGVILSERITGQTPFTGENALTLLRQVRECEAPRPSTIRPGLDPDLETVVLKALEKLEHEWDKSARWSLVCDLITECGRLVPAEAARLAVRLSTAFDREGDTQVRFQLASALVTSASRLEAATAAPIVGHVARALADELRREAVFNSRTELASAMEKTSGLMEPAEAARVGAGLSAALEGERDADVKRALAAALGAVCGQLSPQEAARVCGEAVRGLLRARSAEWTKIAGWAARPPRCRLTTRQLVDLLKMPTCYDDGRRAVLDHLGYIHRRYFVNHWAFVRSAREQNLGLDLSTPPKRPDPKESVQFEK